MKKILFLIFLLFFTSISFAQNLTLSQILSIRKQNIGNAEEYLSQRKWEYFAAKEPENRNLGYIQFAYKVSEYGNRAESFITLYYSSYTISDNQILIQVSNVAKYNEYINQIKVWGGKMIKSYVEKDGLYKIYQGSTMTYVVETLTTQGGLHNSKSKNALYVILVMTNDAYLYSRYFDK